MAGIPIQRLTYEQEVKLWFWRFLAVEPVILLAWYPFIVRRPAALEALEALTALGDD